MRIVLISVLLLIIFTQISFSQDKYFPPTNGNWETTSPSELKWNEEEIENLYQFLQQKNTKAFILLKDGKIVLEKYFDDFTADSNWYWASAGKTLTATLVGIAQNSGFLDINKPTSEYLGSGWTSLDKQQEDKITVLHQLNMTTGLDDSDSVGCTDPECLKFLAEPGTRWSYHNAPYTLLEEVVAKATNQNYNFYTAFNLRNKIGMNGAWIKVGYNNVYFSTPRSMARFGLLIENNGDWDNQTIFADKQYISDMINTSQVHNLSYGYLWWLNGKESYMLPGVRLVFPANLAKDAPNDNFAALGKNGQILSITPSKGIVWVRMGNEPDEQSFVPNLFYNDVWKRLNLIMDNKNSVENSIQNSLLVNPNPASEYIEISISQTLALTSKDIEFKIYDLTGVCILTQSISPDSNKILLSTQNIPPGKYILNIGSINQKFIINR